MSKLQLTIEVPCLRQLEQLHVCCPDLRQLGPVAHNGLLPQGHPEHILHQQGRMSALLHAAAATESLSSSHSAGGE